MLDFKDLITSPRPTKREELKALLSDCDPSVVRLCYSLTHAVLANPILWTMGAFEPKPEVLSEDLVNVILASTTSCGDCDHCSEALRIWWNILRSHALSMSIPEFNFDPLTKMVFVTHPDNGQVIQSHAVHEPALDKVIDGFLEVEGALVAEWAKSDKRVRNWAIQMEKAGLN